VPPVGSDGIEEVGQAIDRVPEQPRTGGAHTAGSHPPVAAAGWHLIEWLRRLNNKVQTFSFIAGNRNVRPVAWLCEVFDVSTAGLYAWLDRPDRLAEQRRQWEVGQ